MALAVVVLAGLVGITVAAARARRLDHFGLGTLPVQVVAQLDRGELLCQTPVAVPERFEAVGLVLDPADRRGPIRITVRRPTPRLFAGGRDVIAAATLPRGVLSGHEETLRLDRPVEAGRFVALCVESRGREPVRVWGDVSGSRTPVTSEALLDGRDTGGDLFLRFPTPRPTSVLARIPAAFGHAAPFKLGGLGAWAFWLLAAAIIVGAPLLLGAALRAACALQADRDDRDDR